MNSLYLHYPRYNVSDTITITKFLLFLDSFTYPYIYIDLNKKKKLIDKVKQIFRKYNDLEDLDFIENKLNDHNDVEILIRQIKYKYFKSINFRSLVKLLKD